MFSKSDRLLSSVGGSPGPEAAVDLDERLFVRLDRVLAQRRRDDRADLVALGEEDLDAVDLLLLRHRDDARRQRLVGLENHLARRRIHDVGGRERAFEGLVLHFDRLDAGLLEGGNRRTW